MPEYIEILDTTLRDGAQGGGISFSVQDKVDLVRTLDELGIAWIEAGNPGSNPKDMDFFSQVRRIKTEHSKLAAFGSTRKKQIKAEADEQLNDLLRAETEGVVIFGKSWDLHVREVICAEPEENLDMIAESVAFLKSRGRFVIFDAEHFFDGYIADRLYALATVKTALQAGADRIVLCDTNGGNFPDLITQAVKDASSVLWERDDLTSFPMLGIHAHNDADMALANSIAAINAGARHAQGTLAGFGERCGNACLASLLPSLELKLGFNCLPQGRLKRLYRLTRKTAEIANVNISDNMPYIGTHAFSHKAGMHTDGVLKTSRSFEHIDPAMVGNDRHFNMSEVSGRSAIANRIKKIDPSITKDHPVSSVLIEKLKKLEAEGWSFEGADASFELLVRQELGAYQPYFSIASYRVLSEYPTGDNIACSHAWVKVFVDGKEEIAAADGDGPVNALDAALRRALTLFFPVLEKARLSDYKVRVINSNAATAARVRVLITSSDGSISWSTVGVSEDIIKASCLALKDSIEYKLIYEQTKADE